VYHLILPPNSYFQKISFSIRNDVYFNFFSQRYVGYFYFVIKQRYSAIAIDRSFLAYTMFRPIVNDPDEELVVWPFDIKWAVGSGENCPY
jgi:hypothetical protein